MPMSTSLFTSTALASVHLSSHIRSSSRKILAPTPTPSAEIVDPSSSGNNHERNHLLHLLLPLLQRTPIISRYCTAPTRDLRRLSTNPIDHTDYSPHPSLSPNLYLPHLKSQIQQTPCPQAQPPASPATQAARARLSSRLASHLGRSSAGAEMTASAASSRVL